MPASSVFHVVHSQIDCNSLFVLLHTFVFWSQIILSNLSLFLSRLLVNAQACSHIIELALMYTLILRFLNIFRNFNSFEWEKRCLRLLNPRLCLIVDHSMRLLYSKGIGIFLLSGKTQNLISKGIFGILSYTLFYLHLFVVWLALILLANLSISSWFVPRTAMTSLEPSILWFIPKCIPPYWNNVVLITFSDAKLNCNPLPASNQFERWRLQVLLVSGLYI